MPRKTDFVTFLDRDLYKDDIVSVAEKHSLPTKGNKVDLIKELVSKTTPKKLIAEFFIADDLKDILNEEGLPISGSKENVEINTTGDTLEVIARVSNAVCWERWGAVQKKISFQAFRKQIRLPEPIEPDKAFASLKNGILRITLPKIRQKVLINVV